MRALTVAAADGSVAFSSLRCATLAPSITMPDGDRELGNGGITPIEGANGKLTSVSKATTASSCSLGLPSGPIMPPRFCIAAYCADDSDVAAFL